MTLLAIGGGLLLAVALLVREYQLGKERNARDAALEHMQELLERNREQLRRSVEDLYVLRTVLAEHRVVSEKELIESRARLIDSPRRQAQERSAMLTGLNLAPGQIIVEEIDPKLH